MRKYYAYRKNGELIYKTESDAKIFGEGFSEISAGEYAALDVERERDVATLKRRLAETDYIACKLAEGVATKEEYADVLAEREQIRVQIRAILYGEFPEETVAEGTAVASTVLEGGEVT